MTVAEAVRELTEAIKEAQLELPGVSTDDAGKILMVNAEGKWVAILPAPELPDTTGASEGDVLTVGSSGLEWGEAGGGGGGIALYGLYVLYGEIAENIAYGSSGVGHITSISMMGETVDTSVLQDGDFFVTVSEDYSQILPPIKKDMVYYESDDITLDSLSITVLNTIDQYTVEQGASFTIYALCSRELPWAQPS